MITDDTMLVTLTAGQLRELIHRDVSQVLAEFTDRLAAANRPNDAEEQPVWGGRALADFLGVSTEWVSHLIRAGTYGDAIFKPTGSRRIGFYPNRLRQRIEQLNSKQQTHGTKH